MIINRNINRIRYWMKLLNQENSVTTKTIYAMQKQDADINTHYKGLNWVFQIKSMLESLGLGFICVQQEEISIPFELIKQRTFYYFQQSWYSNSYLCMHAINTPLSYKLT